MNSNHLHNLGNNGLSEYGEAFIGFLERFYSQHKLGEVPNLKKIILACKRMEQCHEGQQRNNGKPYHIHPYNVAKIYCLSHEKNISTRGIIAAIIHDNKENAVKSNIVEDYDSIKNIFGDEDALICETLSKKDSGVKDRNEEYFSRFTSLHTLRKFLQDLINEKGLFVSYDKIRAMAFKIALIKVSDRIHNLRTMEGFSIEKIQDKISETKKYIQPIAEELGKTHPKILVFFNDAIFAAERQITRKQVDDTI